MQSEKTILGINLSHDTACAAIVGGEVKVAIAEERLNRVKYCNGLSPFGRIIPFRAIKYCCDELGIKPYEVDLFVVNSCRSSAIEHLRAQLLGIREERILDVPHPGHHLAHAYSTFYCSPFDEAAVIVVDTNGSFIERAHHRTDALSHHMQIERKEHYTSFHGTADGIRTITADYVRPGSVSLGELYCIYSAALQLTPADGHYGHDDPLTAGGKLMGLASYDEGKTPAPEICTLESDGHLSIPLSRVVDHLEKRGFVTERRAGLSEIFGFEMRPFVEFELRGDKSLQDERYVSLAGEAQRELERALILIARRVYETTKSENLCVAGGTMLNVTACTRLLEETPFKRIFVQPAANDAGIAIGAGLWGYWNRPNTSTGGRERPYLSKKYNTCLGRIYPNDEVEQAIERAIAASGGRLTAKRLTSLDAKARALLPRIYDDQIIAVFEGRSEFGPRALGHRSFLASPKNASMKDKMNELKHREWYRPVAPVVLAEDFSVYFDAPFDAVPFMTLSARCQPITSERAPAVRHVDGSARPQTITADESPLIHHLLTRMKADAKELPILINTSLNVDKEPIVETPDHAVSAIMQADLLDAILIEDWLLERRR